MNRWQIEALLFVILLALILKLFVLGSYAVSIPTSSGLREDYFLGLKISKNRLFLKRSFTKDKLAPEDLPTFFYRCGDRVCFGLLLAVEGGFIEPREQSVLVNDKQIAKIDLEPFNAFLVPPGEVGIARFLSSNIHGRLSIDLVSQDRLLAQKLLLWLSVDRIVTEDGVTTSKVRWDRLFNAAD